MKDGCRLVIRTDAFQRDDLIVVSPSAYAKIAEEPTHALEMIIAGQKDMIESLGEVILQKDRRIAALNASIEALANQRAPDASEN